MKNIANKLNQNIKNVVKTYIHTSITTSNHTHNIQLYDWNFLFIELWKQYPNITQHDNVHQSIDMSFLLINHMLSDISSSSS